MSPLSAPHWFWILSAGCFGAILGSFINMAAYRLPRNISTIKRSRSFCPKCDHQLAWYDNLPILSYLSLLGKCRYCKVRIPSRYLLTEVIVTALFCLSAYQFFVLNDALRGPYYEAFNAPKPDGFEWWRLLGVFIIQLFLIVDLVLLSVVDLEMWLIPSETTLPWIPIGFVVALIFPELHSHATTWVASPHANAVIDSFTGMVVGAGALWCVGFMVTVMTFLYFRIKNIPERPKEGMGMGDVHLMAMVGAMLGWKPVFATLFLAVFIGSVTGLAKIGWEKIQKRRLGVAYKPWQPVYDVPMDEAPYVPRFWMLLFFGVIIVAMAGWMLSFSGQDFSLNRNYQMAWTQEEQQLGGLMPGQNSIDVRLAPAWMLMLIGVALVAAYPFFKYLAHVDMLPQGSIQDKGDTGEKQEVLEGNYVPFGPSLAAAALIVAFYDPLLRNAAWWFFNGSSGKILPPGYHVIGEENAMAVAMFVAMCIKAMSDFFGGLVGAEKNKPRL